MAHRKILATAAATLLAAAASWPAAASDTPRLDMDVSYSATRIIVAGDQRSEQRIEQRYFQQSAMINRMETELNGQQSVIIMRGDRELMWTVMPQERMVMEMRMDTRPQDPMNIEVPDPETWVMERLGREPVNGIAATKYRVATDAGDKTRMRGHMWVSDDGIPVRMDLVTGQDRIQMELRNLVVGAQPAELFEPPKDYQRLAIGGGMDSMFGGMGGMPGSQTGGPGYGQAGDAGYGSADGAGAAPDTGFAGELATEATEAAKDATKQEVRNTVHDSVRKGVRGLFGR